MKFLLFAVLALCLFGAASGSPGLTRHDESEKIVKLLENILDKFEKGKESNTKYMNKIQSDLTAAEQAVKIARTTYSNEMAEATEHQANAESEERLIKKILAMLKSDVGEHVSHVALSCKEVMKDSSKKDGYYYVSVEGQSKKVYCARQEGRTIFSGTCSTSSLGNGWAPQCLNHIEFNEAEDYLKVKADGLITIARDGVYRITASANMFSEAQRNHFGRILINDKTWAYNYHNAEQNSAEYLKLYYPLKKGDKVQIVWYINAGGKSVRYAGTKSDGSNRVQVDFIGTFESTALFSAGCSSHRTGTAWGPNCVDTRDWTPASIQEQTFSVESNGDVIAKKAGFYHIQANNMQHGTNNYARGRVHIGGTQRYYAYSYEKQWRVLHIDLTYWVNAGERIHIDWMVEGGSPYGRHAMSGTNGYNRAQILYVGGSELTPYQFFGGCSKHSQAKGWQTYCLNSAWRNDLKSELAIAASGVVTVKKSGFYRIAAHAIVHRKQAENAFSRILVDDEIVDSSTVYGMSAWTEMYHDVTLPLVKGQKFQIQYMATNYAYHAWSQHSNVQIMYVDRK